MSNIELLELITRGGTEVLLKQKNFTRRLNALVAFGMIDIIEGEIYVTPKGIQLQKKKDLEQLAIIKEQKELEEFSSGTFKRNLLYVYLSLLFLCTAIIFLSLSIISF